jgi:hypothetical protein
LAVLFPVPNSLAQKAEDGVTRIGIAYLSQRAELPPKLSNLELPPEDEGIAGGRLSIADNNTTGRFL